MVSSHCDGDLVKLYRLGSSIYDSEITAANLLPKHVVVDKTGHICYMGKSLTE